MMRGIGIRARIVVGMAIAPLDPGSMQPKLVQRCEKDLGSVLELEEALH